MRRGLYLHPGFHQPTLSRVPRADHRHEAVMRLTTNVEPPVVGIHALARIVDPATVDFPTLLDHPNRLETASVLLGDSQLEPSLGILRHSPFGVEVSPHVVKALASPH